MSVPDEVMKLKDGKIIVDKLKSMVATQFVEATANDSGAYVVYQGQVYYLPDGHTANTTWANTTKVGPTNIGAELSSVKTAISGKADKNDTVLTSTLSRGRTNTAGLGSVAFGDNVTAKGNYSQAFGQDTEANEDHSYAEGVSTQSNARYAHAEGAYANADGGASHTQGFHTTAEFPCSDAGGMYNYLYSVTTWAKNTTYAVGRIVRRTVNPESKVYKCNTAHTSGTSFDSSKWDDITNQALLESIGNGTGIYANRSTARSLDRAGNERLKGDLYVCCNADSTGGTKVAKETVIAPAFDVATANAAETYVMYTDGVVYYLPDGHTADTTWENTNKTATNIGAEITDVKTAIQGKYTKPSGGIPATDMSEEVQNTLSGVGKSENRDGIVQSTDTATKNITSGQYVIWNGSLYTASANIAIGETLSLSNLDPVSDGGFNALRDEIEKKHRIKAYKKYVQQEQSTGAVWVVLDEPIDIENGDEIEVIIYQSDKANYGTSWSNTASWNAATIQNKNNTSISLQDDKYMNSDKPAMKIIKKMDGYVMYQTFSNNALTGFGIDLPANFDSFKRMLVDPVSSQLKAGCTVEITIKQTI